MRPEHLERTWQTPESIHYGADFLINALSRVDSETPFDQIVVTTKVAPFVGIGPLAGNLSVSLEKGLVFWREPGGLFLSAPRIIGSKDLGPKVAILDEITYPGNTRLILESLVGQDFVPVAFISLHNLDTEGQQMLELPQQRGFWEQPRYYPPEFVFQPAMI